MVRGVLREESGTDGKSWWVGTIRRQQLVHLEFVSDEWADIILQGETTKTFGLERGRNT